MEQGDKYRSAAVPLYLEMEALGIGHTKNKQTALFQNITANTGPGVLIALFGRNGIGKSTLLRTLAGLQEPVSGQIRLLGTPIHGMAPSELAKKISYLSSQILRTPKLSVTDMVSFGRYGFTNWLGQTQEADRMAVAQALKKTGLGALAQRDSSSLSDGELQRASIARSLVQDTPVMLLDEPTAFLDMGNKYTSVYLLQQLCHEEGKTIIFSTHDLSLALQVCDEIWIMGEDLFHSGTPQHLLQEGIFDNIFKHTGLAFDRRTLSYRPM